MQEDMQHRASKTSHSKRDPTDRPINDHITKPSQHLQQERSTNKQSPQRNRRLLHTGTTSVHRDRRAARRTPVITGNRRSGSGCDGCDDPRGGVVLALLAPGGVRGVGSHDCGRGGGLAPAVVALLGRGGGGGRWRGLAAPAAVLFGGGGFGWLGALLLFC